MILCHVQALVAFFSAFRTDDYHREMEEAIG
jgi:hypothetical protein